MYRLRFFYCALSIIVGMNISHGMEDKSKESSIQFDFKKEAPCLLGVYNFCSSPHLSTLIYELREFPVGFSIDGLKPTCSILMHNGVKIDYVPGQVAVWVGCKDRSPASFFEGNLILTGTIDNNDIYSLSTLEFIDKIMKVDSICFAQPTRSLLLDNGVIPEMFEEWLEKMKMSNNDYIFINPLSLKK